MADRMQWEKFWYRDFCDDLLPATLATKGFWIFCLSRMWGSGGSAEITGSFQDFSKWCGCDENEAQKAITELNDRNICDVIFSSRERECNAECNINYVCDVTLRNRRLKREEKTRENQRLRIKRFREKMKCNGIVTEKKQKNNGLYMGKKIEERGKKIEERINTFVQTELETLKKAYPAIDLTQESAKAIAWLKANPKNMKKNISRYLNNWFSRAQDRAPIMERPQERINKTFTQCPKCGKETTKEDLRNLDSCPSCFKPIPIDKLKNLISGIGKDVK